MNLLKTKPKESDVRFVVSEARKKTQINREKLIRRESKDLRSKKTTEPEPRTVNS